MSEYIVELTPKLYTDLRFRRGEEIVRCRDCVHYKPYRTHQHGMMNRCHDEHGHTHKRDESDFCSRGERADNFTTCKCGEDIETNGREPVTCPSCGRVITE